MITEATYAVNLFFAGNRSIARDNFLVRSATALIGYNSASEKGEKRRRAAHDAVVTAFRFYSLGAVDNFLSLQDHRLCYHPKPMDNKSLWMPSFWEVITVVITLIVMAVIVWFMSWK